MPETDILDRETYAERARLADLLATLGPEQWSAPSLCAGWRVREVVAHITMPYRVRPARLLAGLVRARLSFDRYADRQARADTAHLSDAELLACLRANLTTPWRPPGGGAAGALSHDVIHGLDLTVPLGLPGPPPERIALVLDHAGRHLDHFGFDPAATRLVATDADVSLGHGSPREMRLVDVLLTVAGRPVTERP